MAFATTRPLVTDRRNSLGPGLASHGRPIVSPIFLREALAVRTFPQPSPPPPPPPLPPPSSPPPAPPLPSPSPSQLRPQSAKLLTVSLRLNERAALHALFTFSLLVEHLNVWSNHIPQYIESLFGNQTRKNRVQRRPAPFHIFMSKGNVSKGTENGTAKLRNADMKTRLAIIRDDFIQRQYYVTGRLTSSLYRDNCFFDAPDPGGRVRGVAKFSNATARLFDQNLSRVDLIDIYERDESHIVAEWRLQGALMLPWRPFIKPYLGSTIYEFDECGLVRNHNETWQISAFDAFVSVFWKGFGAPPAPPADVVREQKGISQSTTP